MSACAVRCPLDRGRELDSLRGIQLVGHLDADTVALASLLIPSGHPLLSIEGRTM